eukprot:gene9191-16865_t
MERRLYIFRHLFGKAAVSAIRNNRRHNLLLAVGITEHKRPKSDIVQTPVDSKIARTSEKEKDVQVSHTMKHLMKGEDKFAKIKRVSFFRGKMEQRIDKRHILAFENALTEERTKEGFVRVVHDFLAKDRLKRGHLSFVSTSLNYMDSFGLHKDLDVYNEILEVFPKYVITNKTLLDALWPKPHPQIDIALDLLTKMEDNGIRPDDLTYTILLEIFGKAGLPVQKAQRMAYWFDKYQHANPYLVSDEDLKDRFKLCKLALTRMTMDEENIKVYTCEDDPGSIYKKSFIIGCQNEEQREFLATHDASKTLYLEGPYHIWMNHIKEQYYLLRSQPIDMENPITHEDDTRVREGIAYILIV